MVSKFVTFTPDVVKELIVNDPLFCPASLPLVITPKPKKGTIPKFQLKFVKERPNDYLETITQKPRADKETILMHTDNYRPDITLFKDIYAKPWIRDYTLAVSKVMLGEARGKFNTIAGPQGGTTLNGDALKNEGTAEMERLEADIGNFQEGGTPHSFVIG